jgi:hypothetical protein
LKKALDLKVLKKKAIVLTKPMLIHKLKRRNPTLKLNANNKKGDDLFHMLDKNDLNEDDKEFIIATISRYLRRVR